MKSLLPRLLLTFASLVLGLGGLVHATAFPKAAAALRASQLPTFYAGSCEGLWLADSSTLIVLAIAFAFAALRPAAFAGATVALLALIPASTATLIYLFVGPFLPAHLLLTASIAAGLAGLLLRAPESSRAPAAA